MQVSDAFFEPICGFYTYIFFKEDNNSYLRSFLAKKLDKKLRNLILICQQNLLHVQKQHKYAYNKDIKP